MQKSRAMRVGSLLVGLTLVAAACGSDDDAATTTDAPAETEAPAVTEAPADDAPAADGADGILRLGGILPETGNLAFLGPPEFAGVELAVADVNAAGGVLGNDVEWLPGDSGDNGEVANATVDRLLAENVDGFIGAASSGVSLTVIDKITQAGKVHFSPANTSPTFTDYDDNGLYFRTAPSDVVQGAALADIMIADGAASATFLVLNDAYGTGLLEYTQGPFEAQGGEVDLAEIYDPKAENFDDVVAKAVDADSDAIVIIGFDETSKILTGLIENGVGPADKLVYGTDGNMGNALAEAFDDPTVLAGMRGTLPGVDVAGELQDFRDQLDGIDPDLKDYSYAAESYDTVVIMALAATVAGSDDGVAIGAEINDVTRGGEKCTTYADCLALATAGTDFDYDGVSGPLEFRDEGEPTQASILILEFDETGTIVVKGAVQGSVEVSGGDAPADDAPAADGADGILRLGGILPETGNLAFLGPPEFAGVELAVADVNAAGGVLGNDVEWLPGDSGDNGEVANATVDRLLAENVDGFIGAASSGVSLTVIDKITQAGKVHFSPANTSPTFTDYDDNGLYFRTAPSDVVQGAALADIMIADGAASATFLVLNDAYGTGLLEYTQGPFEAQGGEVDLAEIYDPKAENFDDVVAKAVDADSDAIVIIGFDETSKILTGLIENGVGPADKLVYGTDGNMGNALAEAFDDPTVLAGMRGTLPGVDVAGELQDFRDQLDGIDPDLKDYSYAAESYDTVVIMALAATVAGSDDGVAIGAEINDVTRGGEKCTTYADCLALATAGTDFDYDGVSGPLEFRDEGEPTQASILILEFDETGTIVVKGAVQGSVEV
ncbi:ABC transporter substrate-binding protein [uncultured Ilumatobacter sp.]|uniref:ABC transporter substrate-binding protein n=1 Tax=uncultured Ilumatobacter sp. TaxID=879968 RepID=UPI00374F65FF